MHAWQLIAPLPRCLSRHVELDQEGRGKYLRVETSTRTPTYQRFQSSAVCVEEHSDWTAVEAAPIKASMDGNDPGHRASATKTTAFSPSIHDLEEPSGRPGRHQAPSAPYTSGRGTKPPEALERSGCGCRAATGFLAAAMDHSSMSPAGRRAAGQESGLTASVRAVQASDIVVSLPTKDQRVQTGRLDFVASRYRRT